MFIMRQFLVLKVPELIENELSFEETNRNNYF